MELEDAVHTAMLALKENFEGEVGSVCAVYVDERAQYPGSICINRNRS